MDKALFSALAAMLLAGMASAQDAKIVPQVVNPITSSIEVPAFEWNETTHNFGNIPQGIPATLTYTFKNTGNAALVISNVQPACGCTGADWSKESIEPGKSGFVKITFNAANMGAFTKSLTVVANTKPEVVTLSFGGEVVAAANDSPGNTNVK